MTLEVAVAVSAKRWMFMSYRGMVMMAVVTVGMVVMTMVN